MSPVLPFEIFVLIIDIAAENKDTDLLKKLALVSHSFIHICSQHLFSTIELHDADRSKHVASSKKGFLKLLKSRPDVVHYIRKLTYKASHNSPKNYDHRLSPFLRTISRLNCLTITGKASKTDWNKLNSSLTSAFLHLMYLPTINHIDLSFFRDFPLSSLTASVNLHRLDILHMRVTLSHENNEIAMPNIREFHALESTLLTKLLLLAKRQDGRPSFNFRDLRRLSMSINFYEDQRNIQYLLQNAKLIEEFHLSVGPGGPGRDLRGLHDILSPSARTLKILDLTVFLNSISLGLIEELDAMTGHNILEALTFELRLYVFETLAEDSIGSIIQKVESVLVKPGWSALRQVSFKVSISCWEVSWGDSAELLVTLQSLPDKYLSHLPKLESVAFDFSTYVKDSEFSFL
jgi:hypothetical protein